MSFVGVASYLRPNNEGLGLPMKLVLDDVKIGIHEASSLLLIDKGVAALAKNSKRFSAQVTR
jgi:hypothetical protein